MFYGRGINATGIDTVLADAGVAKGSMYHHFDGKQGLVLAYLRQELDLWRRRAELLDRPDRPAGERVGLLFSALAGSVDDGTFHGCPFTNAVIERPDDPAVGQVVADYRQAFARHLGALTGAPAEDPLVGHLMLLYDGAMTAAKLTHDSAAVRMAGTLAQKQTVGALKLFPDRPAVLGSEPDVGGVPVQWVFERHRATADEVDL